MMETLNSVLERKTIGAKRYLKQRLMSLKCPDDKSLSTFFNEYEAGGKLDEMETVIDLLNAMPYRYEHVVTALETLEEKDMTLNRIKTRMLEAELKCHSNSMEEKQFHFILKGSRIKIQLEKDHLLQL